jgi:hypothetical protein
MSNCVVRSCGSRLPCSFVADHGIEGGDHLSHDGDDNDFRFLVGCGETIVKDLEGGIVSGCAEGSHVEDVTDWHAAAVDAAMSFELAAVEVVRRKSDEGSDLLAAHLPELWQESDKSEGQRRTHAAHRGQQFIALRENGIGSDYLGHAFVKQMDIGLKPREATFVEAPQYSILNMSGLVLDRDMLVAKLPPHGDDFGEPFGGGGTLNNACRHDRDVFCNQLRIEAIVLGEDAAGTGELTKFARIDASNRQASCEQSSDDAALVAAARLDPDCGDRQSMQPFDQLGPPGAVVSHRKVLPARQHLDVQAILRYVNSTVAMFCHLRAPSLLMRARALATVREWKKRLERQAHSRSIDRGGRGLPVETGAMA